MIGELDVVVVVVVDVEVEAADSESVFCSSRLLAPKKSFFKGSNKPPLIQPPILKVNTSDATTPAHSHRNKVNCLKGV